MPATGHARMHTYLDNNATTPLDPRVCAVLHEWHSQQWGNASSRDHRWGWSAADAVEDARVDLADVMDVAADRVVFMSGATEAVNTVIRGYVGFDGWTGKTIVTCATEHDAVLATSRYLCARTGVALEILPVDRAGGVEMGRLRATLDAAPGALVALMAANNEIGTLHPVREIADVVHAAGGMLLCDATQALGRSAFDFGASAADFVAVSSHKAYGPKGVGALIAGRHAPDHPLDPLIIGGGQERGMRGGTLNVPGIVGFGEACRLVAECLDDDVPRMQSLRDRLECAVLADVPGTWVNGDRVNRLCNTTSIGFSGVDARTLIRDMHDVAVSTRSACSSGTAEPSHVLKAIGLSDKDAYACIRFSLGRFTTQHEIDYAIGNVVASVHKLRRAMRVRR